MKDKKLYCVILKKYNGENVICHATAKNIEEAIDICTRWITSLTRNKELPYDVINACVVDERTISYF